MNRFGCTNREILPQRIPDRAERVSDSLHDRQLHSCHETETSFQQSLHFWQVEDLLALAGMALRALPKVI